ncbi:MAG TPA: DNA polymerase III subunit gamma/tau, partial [Dehalococcoidia bacterium]|nr:DNA polymerase III subunit gamma/tau [Dehalococcoidia bacterium]
MSTEVLYRKWRPERFADVTGQAQVTRTLLNAITLNRVGHAYLFAGPRGTGKTTVARIFGKAINCEKPVEGEACNDCEPCKAFASGAFDFIEIDAASNRGVDDADRLRKQVNYAPSVGRYRVYLVDEVHMLSKQAFNALLKTLEEPPGHVVFILATTEAHDVLPTVTSRCQRFDFRRHTTGDVVGRLAYICKEEGFELDEQSLSIMARAATGSLRDAINLLEQVVSSHGPKPTLEQVQDELGMAGDARAYQLARQLFEKDLAGCLATITAVVDEGVELKRFLRDIKEALRSTLMAASGASASLDLGKEQMEQVAEIAELAGSDEATRALKVFGQVELKDTGSSLPLELAAAEYIVQANQRAEVAASAARLPQAAATPVPARPAPRQPERASQPPQRQQTRRPAMTPKTNGVVEPLPPLPGVESDVVQQIRGRWREVLDETRKRNFRVSGMLNGNSDVCGYENGVVTFGFRHQFHAEQMASGGDGQFLSVLEETVKELFGPELSVRCIHRADVREPDKGAPAGSSGGHLLKEAMDLGGK